MLPLIKRLVLVVFALGGTLPCFAQACLSYEPAIVPLRGTLVRKTFPGPPEYKDIRKGDRPETYWLLRLDQPACLDQDRKEPDLNPARKNIRLVQLVVEPRMYKEKRTLIGRRVIVTGTLFGEHTAHHHTPVLMTVLDLAQPN